MFTEDNPRGSDGLIRAGIVVGGGFLLFRMAQRGAFGPAVAQAANDVWGSVPAVPTVAVSTGPGTIAVGARPAASASASAPASGRPCPQFVTGVQYVAARADGSFETVIGGQLVFTGTQAEAEARYRAAFGC